MLSEYKRTFQDSTERPGEADTCGYCGKEFTRSGYSSASITPGVGIAIRHATEQDWKERLQHVQYLHKFGQCSSAKKFYRADHFRQHLRYSHAGMNWRRVNVLEAACRIDEVTTRKRRWAAQIGGLSKQSQRSLVWELDDGDGRQKAVTQRHAQ